MMNSCTENYECLVLDNTSKSNKIEDVVFWYKARIFTPGDFRIGNDQYWKCHSQKYNPKHDEADYEMIDPNKTKKNRIALNVKKVR